MTDREAVAKAVTEQARKLRMSTEPGSDFGEILALLAPRTWAPGESVVYSDTVRAFYDIEGALMVSIVRDGLWDHSEAITLAYSLGSGLPLRLPAAPARPTYTDEDVRRLVEAAKQGRNMLASSSSSWRSLNEAITPFGENDSLGRQPGQGGEG